MASTGNLILRRTALSVALGASVFGMGHVQAQSNTTGTVFGQAATGDTIIIENPATGFRREVSVGADGSYRVPALQPGTYKVTHRRADGSTSVREGIAVAVGTGTAVNFTAAAGQSGDVGAINVTGRRLVNPIDVSSVESTTVLTAQQLARVPVPRDTTSVALLAPGTVRGDAAFGNLASFGGSSVAENQYYVNGFNVTNSFRSLNFSKVAFEGIQEQQVKTGGYGAEFGRSLGGVVNQITKRGTNEFKGGASIYWTPGALRSEVRSVFYANPLEPTSLGRLAEDNSKDTEDLMAMNIWAGGALIQDRLFAYGLLSFSNSTYDVWGDVDAFTNRHRQVRNPNWLLKFDWNLNDNNKIEFTAFSDTQRTTSSVYATPRGTVNRGAYAGRLIDEQGGTNYVLKYTGYLTDNFTLTALYGRGTFKRSQYMQNADGSRVSYSGVLSDAYTTSVTGTTALGGCPVIIDVRPSYRKAVTGAYGSYCNLTNGGLLQAGNNRDRRDQFRVDAEWVLGSHQLRFGLDIDNYQSIAGEANPGGWLWRYSTVNPDGSAQPNGDEYDIVRRQTTARGTTVEVKQRAFYIEDSWKVTDTFMLYLGARWDTFKNLNTEGTPFVQIQNQFGPRLGFSWDVNGDSSFKIYGNAGRYALPLTPSVAVRGSSASIYQRSNRNRFASVDPVTGVPLDAAGRPIAINPLSLINGEDGRAHDPRTIAATNLQPMYQDEFILGFQRQMSDHLTFGTRAIFRSLKAAIDDNCDYNPLVDAFKANGTPYQNPPSPGFPYCRLFNPGQDAVYVTDPNADGRYVTTTIPAALLSPRAKRSYRALEFFLDGSWDRFFFQASYTLAWNRGNTEGGVKSDIGQGDTNTTQDFDYKELAVDTFGYLPNDRRHALKVFGNYTINDEWSVGANLLVQSGRPMNCLGVLYPFHGGYHSYGSSFMRCGTTSAGQQIYLDGPNKGQLIGPVQAFPRGTYGRLPWTNQLDLNVAYKPHWMPGLTFKVDVFNVFNSQKVTAVSETAEDSANGAPLSTFMLNRSYQTPRSVRFMLQYDF